MLRHPGLLVPRVGHGIVAPYGGYGLAVEGIAYADGLLIDKVECLVTLYPHGLCC